MMENGIPTSNRRTQMTSRRLSEEEYYELLDEARNAVPCGGLAKIYNRMLGEVPSHAWKYTYWQWFLGPWLEHHDLLYDLEKEYGDE